jgi:hypothetical protein
MQVNEMSNSETVICPKCFIEFPMSKMHDHYRNCTGKITNLTFQVIYCPDCDLKLGICKRCFKQAIECDCPKGERITEAPKQPLPPIYKEPERIIKQEIIKPSFCKKCGSEYIESDMFRVCPKDKIIKIKMKMWWWIILRYGLMIFWVAYALGAFTVVGLYHR